MMYSPGVPNFYPKYISPLSQYSVGIDIASFQWTGNNNTTNWTANRAMYVPLYLPRQLTITKFFTQNAGTAAGNTDVGIYDVNGTKLTSTGAVAMSGTNTIQEFDITDYGIGRGMYWMAISNSSTGRFSTIYNSTASRPSLWAALGIHIEAAAHPLPSTLSLATYTDALIVPVFGIVTR